MEMKITRALTEELVKVGLENLRDDIFEEAVCQIEDDYEASVECQEEKTLNELAKSWIEETKINCPIFLTQKLKTFEDVEEYYEKNNYSIECRKLWTIKDETTIAIKDTDPMGGYNIHLITLKNGTIYNEKGEDIIEIDIDNQL